MMMMMNGKRLRLFQTPKARNKRQFAATFTFIACLVFFSALWVSNLHCMNELDKFLHHQQNDDGDQQLYGTREHLMKNLAIRNNATRTTSSTLKKYRKRKKAKGKQQEQDSMTTSLEYVQSFQKINRPLAFIHIPKGAGTTIENVAAAHNVSWGSCAFPRNTTQSMKRCPKSPHIIGESQGLYGKWGNNNVNPWHAPRDWLPLAGADPYMGNELFAVVRNVYTRMVSEFYFACIIFPIKVRTCNAARKYEPEHLNEWIMWKFSMPHMKNKQDGHFAPQYKLIVNPLEVRLVDYVLRFENISAEFKSLMDVFDLQQIQLGSVRVMTGLHKKGTTPLTVEHLYPRTIRTISEVFAKDVDVFHYETKTASLTREEDDDDGGGSGDDDSDGDGDKVGDDEDGEDQDQDNEEDNEDRDEDRDEDSDEYHDEA